MRRAATVLLMVLVVAACGEDTSTRFNGQDLGELCRSLEAEFMKEPAPDRPAHVARFLRAIAGTSEWAGLSTEDRRAVEDTVERARTGDC